MTMKVVYIDGISEASIDPQMSQQNTKFQLRWFEQTILLFMTSCRRWKYQENYLLFKYFQSTGIDFFFPTI
jgi:hypothetical protein